MAAASSAIYLIKWRAFCFRHMDEACAKCRRYDENITSTRRYFWRFSPGSRIPRHFSPRNRSAMALNLKSGGVVMASKAPSMASSHTQKSARRSPPAEETSPEAIRQRDEIKERRIDRSHDKCVVDKTYRREADFAARHAIRKKQKKELWLNLHAPRRAPLAREHQHGRKLTAAL